MITAKEPRPVDASGRPDLAKRRRDEIIASDDDKAKKKEESLDIQAGAFLFVAG
jgi:hypothetical protein